MDDSEPFRMTGDSRTKRDWAKVLFVDHPQVFLPWMKSMIGQAKMDVRGLQTVFEKFQVRKGARILDLACGIGRISINLAKAGYKVVGIDISRLYLDFAKEEDAEMLTSLLDIASPHVVLVIETVNRDYLVKHFEEESVSTLEGVEWREFRRLNLENSFMENEWRFYRKKTSSRRLILRVPVSHRVYSLHELKQLITNAGWKYPGSYGTPGKLSTVTTDSFHMTVIGQR